MATDYPKKYWWIIFIVVPIVAALIPALTEKEAGDGSITFNNHDEQVTQF